MNVNLRIPTTLNEITLRTVSGIRKAAGLKRNRPTTKDY